MIVDVCTCTVRMREPGVRVRRTLLAPDVFLVCVWPWCHLCGGRVWGCVGEGVGGCGWSLPKPYQRCQCPVRPVCVGVWSRDLSCGRMCGVGVLDGVCVCVCRPGFLTPTCPASWAARAHVGWSVCWRETANARTRTQTRLQTHRHIHRLPPTHTRAHKRTGMRG